MVGLSPDELVLGRYRLVRELGRGLGGVTWLAHDESTAERVALKVVREADAGDPEAFTALLAEAGKLRAMPEEHVVSYLGVHDFKREGWAALLTEYVPGGDLDAHLRECGAYSEIDAARLGLQIARAVAAVHERGVMHRDLKPANVLVTPREGLPTLRVADFGISRKLRQGRLEGTRPVGTRGYAAPEQFVRGRLTFAVDVYALGGVLWFLRCAEDPPEELELEGRLGDLIRACRHLDPERRPLLGEVVEALDALVEGREPRRSVSTVDWSGLVDPAPEPELTEEPTAEELVDEILSERLVRRRRIGVAFTLLILLALAAVKRLAFPNDAPLADPVEVTPELPVPVVEEALPEIADEVVEVAPAPPRLAPPPDPGRLELHSHPWSSLEVGHEPMGRTGGKPISFEVDAGVVEVLFVAEDGRRHAKELRVRPGEVTSYCWNHDVEEEC